MALAFSKKIKRNQINMENEGSIMGKLSMRSKRARKMDYRDAENRRHAAQKTGKSRIWLMADMAQVRRQVQRGLCRL